MNVRKELAPTTELRDQLRSGILVELWENRPIIETRKDESEGAEEDATIEVL